MADGPLKLQVTPVEPVRVEKRGAVYFADFGRDVYGNLQIEFGEALPAAELTVRLGEKLDASGAVDRTPPGSVNYREITLRTQAGKRLCQLDIPTRPAHKQGAVLKAPPGIGEVTPFRYAEIENSPRPLDKSSLRQLFVHAPFDDKAAAFDCSDETLSAVWQLCQHTMKATSAFGVYIDSERERLAYEADAYINQLSHYACDLDARVARRTFEHLLKNPTWPTEWSLHMPMIAAADYEATGDITLARTHYDELKKKLLMDRARADGLVRAEGIVDWPAVERDDYNAAPGARQVGPEINTVVNALYYNALRRMALLSRAMEKPDARALEDKAAQVRQSFNRVFFDVKRGVYIDGEGSTHASLHANMLPLAFGLVPSERQKAVADFVQSRGMACSVYGAQYLLEALFEAGRDDYAIGLMSAKTQRSWWHMIELGSTMTLEAWDAKFKPNLTWNHAWGAAPANIIARYVLGVRPLEPGYKKILIAPQPGALQWARGKVPTPRGPVIVRIDNARRMKLQVEIPDGATARVLLPRRDNSSITLDDKTIAARAEERFLVIDGIEAGRHVLESAP